MGRTALKGETTSLKHTPTFTHITHKTELTHFTSPLI